ncbi:hypothetical protein L6R52_25625 [Myxococcota bacterium]|nr:hypothetical protein [Myxococcota bacterium]
MTQNIVAVVSLALALTLSACAGGAPSSLENEIDEAVAALDTAPPSGGCTRPGGWWKNHHAYATTIENQLPWPVSEDTPVCSTTLYGIISTPVAKGDVWHVLSRQITVAVLNIQNGASAPQHVRDALAAAKALAGKCTITPAEQLQAFQIYGVLDAYNMGIIGPGTCP